MLLDPIAFAGQWLRLLLLDPISFRKGKICKVQCSNVEITVNNGQTEEKKHYYVSTMLQGRRTHTTFTREDLLVRVLT
jgi:hypothetical protein